MEYLLDRRWLTTPSNKIFPPLLKALMRVEAGQLRHKKALQLISMLLTQRTTEVNRLKVKFLDERFRAKNNSKDGCTGATEATVLVPFVTLQISDEDEVEAFEGHTFA